MILTVKLLNMLNCDFMLTCYILFYIHMFQIEYIKQQRVVFRSNFQYYPVSLISSISRNGKYLYSLAVIPSTDNFRPTYPYYESRHVSPCRSKRGVLFKFRTQTFLSVKRVKMHLYSMKILLLTNRYTWSYRLYL